ncbi:MAG: flippase [Candidatus Thermoplasmatota archaeon]|nr:flippase [Candidatus Thermoplasmatota archaeon]MBS3790065.1 flippase [Candidatus Thermoplasmatota archaeon]
MTDRFEKVLETISKGAAIVLFGSFLAKGLAFLSKAILAKYYGPNGLGLIALALMILGITTKLSAGGFDAALKKFIPKFLVDDDQKKVSGTMLTVLLISLLLSGTTGVFIYLFSYQISVTLFNSQSLSPLLKIFALLIPLQSLLVLLSHIFLAFERTKIKVTFRDIGEHLSHFLLFLVVIGIGGSIVNIAYTYLLTGAILVFLSFVVLEKKVYPFLKILASRSAAFIPKKILGYSLPLLFSGIFVLGMGWTDTFMLGFYKTEDVVGIYNLVLSVSLLLLIFLHSINQIFFPVISDLHAKKEFDGLARTFGTVLRWIFFLTFPFFLFLIVFAEPILTIFFPKYVPGWRALVILGIGMMFRAGLGPVGHTLKTYSETHFIFKMNAVLLPLNVGLNIVLIPVIGLEGAAIATATVFIINNIVEMWKVRTIISFDLSFISYLKYTIASVSPLIVLYLFYHFFFVNWWLLISTFAVYLLVYLLISIKIGGMKKEDIVLFRVFDIIMDKLGLKWFKVAHRMEKYLE